MSSAKQYLRFTRPQRLEHWILVLCFLVLAFTGLPQKFAGNGWAETLIGWLGGIETVRTLHHIAATVLLLVGIYHFVELFYKAIVLRVRWSIYPQLQDVLDAVNTLLYNAGLRKEAPQFDHFSFSEKFEYWALVWGTVIMALTGLMLWNPIISTQFLPGDAIPAAKAAHGAEAILAVLAVLIWHAYNVHLKVLNTSMLTGKMPEHEMREEHALELARLERAPAGGGPAPEKIRQRQRVYVPIAAVMGLVLVFGVYLFVTATTTVAISTLPLRVTQQVYVPQTRTPTAQPPTVTPTAQPTATVPAGQATPTAGAAAPTSAPTSAPAGGGIPALPADHAGRSVCSACHSTGVGGAPKSPPDHAGRLDTTCLDCHKPQ